MPGDDIWIARRPRIPSVGFLFRILILRCLSRLQGSSTALGMLRLRLFETAVRQSEILSPIDYHIYSACTLVAEDVTISREPHFLWITEFPLFTRDDPDKDTMAKGRWSSSHHPFTAPMWQDVEAMYNGQIEAVRKPNKLRCRAKLIQIL
jgi:aspartyl-tRNA synthetase